MIEQYDHAEHLVKSISSLQVFMRQKEVWDMSTSEEIPDSHLGAVDRNMHFLKSTLHFSAVYM